MLHLQVVDDGTKTQPGSGRADAGQILLEIVGDDPDQRDVAIIHDDMDRRNGLSGISAEYRFAEKGGRNLTAQQIVVRRKRQHFDVVGDAGYARPWAIPLVVVLGSLLAGFIVFTWAPEAEGHGTDAAIDAIDKNPHGIRIRVVVVKIIASALTIGSGGSGGREGPTAQISAGFGSLLARVLGLSPEDGRIAVAVGVGSGIGAMFGAPLGGAVLAADVVYRDDFEAEALLPGLFSSIVAWALFGAFFGYRPLFSMPGVSLHRTIAAGVVRGAGNRLRFPRAAVLEIVLWAHRAEQAAAVHQEAASSGRRGLCRPHRASPAAGARHRGRLDPGRPERAA